MKQHKIRRSFAQYAFQFLKFSTQSYCAVGCHHDLRSESWVPIGTVKSDEPPPPPSPATTTYENTYSTNLRQIQGSTLGCSCVAAVKGTVFVDPAMPSASPQERSAAYRGMAETLAALHNQDYRELGLNSFGRDSGYCSRQVDLYTMAKVRSS